MSAAPSQPAVLPFRDFFALDVRSLALFRVCLAVLLLLDWAERLTGLGVFYADAGLQIVYFGLSVYGWWAWLHGGTEGTQLSVTRVAPLVLAGLVAAALGFTAALGTYFALRTDAALPYLDSALTSFSLVAQLMLTRKWLENWVLWIALDVVYVGMFLQRGKPLTAFLYFVFLILATAGLVEWRASLKATATLEAAR